MTLRYVYNLGMLSLHGSLFFSQGLTGRSFLPRPAWGRLVYSFFKQALQSATIKLQSYITELEAKVNQFQKKK